MAYLGHYTSMAKLELIFENMSLKFGCLENTNDPYENRNIFFTYKSPSMSGGQIATPSDYYYKNEKTKDKFYVQCFSKIDDRYGIINKPRMWSQYADNHNGCCLILNQDEFDRDFSKLRHHKIDSSEIVYDLNDKRNDIDNLSKKLSKFVDEKTNIDIIREFIWENRKVYIFKKMKDWKEESEFRYCIFSSKTNDNIYINITNSIESIVLGDRVSNFMRNAISEFCRNKNITLTQVFWNNGTPVEQNIPTILEKKNPNIKLKEKDFI